MQKTITLIGSAASAAIIVSFPLIWAYDALGSGDLKKAITISLLVFAAWVGVTYINYKNEII